MTDKTPGIPLQHETHLKGIPQSSLDLLFSISSRRELKKGAIILRPGQICKKIVWVENGYLRTFIDREGRQINTCFTFEKHFATNLQSLRGAVPSHTTIQAGEAAVIAEFDKDRLLELYKKHPAMETLGRQVVEQLLINQEEQAHLFQLLTPTERYQYLERAQPQILQRVSLTQIASYLGVTRETISRIRKNGIANSL